MFLMAPIYNHQHPVKVKLSPQELATYRSQTLDSPLRAISPTLVVDDELLSNEV